ncbi:MAG: helix-turn-helix domain-containing protein, partial [Bacilli bacterium]|nr:helix-turn-helix domain-containing protein [Bacilli bacterium]
MTFAEKLLFVRAELNISQTQLAEQLGVAFTTINRWENSKVKPTRKAEIQFENFCKK